MRPLRHPREKKRFPRHHLAHSRHLNNAFRLRPGAFDTIDNPAAVSGFKLLDRSEDALRWRLALIDAATQSIDTQYYLYHGDSTGLIFTSRLLAAADRGVTSTGPH